MFQWDKVWAKEEKRTKNGRNHQYNGSEKKHNNIRRIVATIQADNKQKIVIPHATDSSFSVIIAFSNWKVDNRIKKPLTARKKESSPITEGE